MLELQVSAVAIRSKLIPFIFMVFELCFYRLLFVNEASVRNAFTILSIYEVIHIPVFLYRYFNYKQTGFQYIPKALLNFFQSYWALLTKFQSNKIWSTSSFLVSKVDAKVILFDYPSVLTYMAPFRRFSRLFYRVQPVSFTSRDVFLNYTHSVLKLKLFSYGWFYK